MEVARDEEPQATRPQILVVDDYAPNVTALRALLEPIAADLDLVHAFPKPLDCPRLLAAIRRFCVPKVS